MNFISTNARSLTPKIHSLCDYFVDLDLSFAAVTETWMRDGVAADKICVDLLHGSGLKTILKNRPVKNQKGNSGGGVAIVHDPEKISFKNIQIKGNHEILAALGRIPGVRRRVAVYCIYVPPKTRLPGYRGLTKIVANSIHKMKIECNPYVILTGDFNRRGVTELLADFPDIEIMNTDPTRLGATLDLLCTNIDSIKTKITEPLETVSGRKSDHMVIHAECSLDRVDNFTKRKSTYYKKTIEGEIAFMEDLIQIDWTERFLGKDSPTDMAEVLNTELERLKKKHFEEVKRVIKSTDAPWMSKRIQDMIEKRKRIYSGHKKNDAWRKQKNATAAAVKKAKKDYLDRTVEMLTSKGGNRTPYTAIKNLRSHDKPKLWDVRSLQPEMSDKELAEDMAEFFNKISDEFRPLHTSDIPESYASTMPRIEEYEVSARLKNTRKPKTITKGDLFPSLVERSCDFLAIPLTQIYNSIITRREWPRQWKEEIVTVIPKTGNASSYEECRNISCTPLFSKIMESFMLDKINGEVARDPLQYGGVKKSGAEHMLLQAWDSIIRGLEDPTTSFGLISIDFAKAFNRMAHQACLRSYKKKGASSDTLSLIYSFLEGRSMRIKVGDTLSDPRPICGGSPQGCVSANALFCATIQYLQEGEVMQERDEADASMIRVSVPVGVEDLEGTITGGDDSFVPFHLNGIESDDSTPRDPNPDPIGTPFRPSLNSTEREYIQDEYTIRAWRPKQRYSFDTTESCPPYPTRSMMRDALSFNAVATVDEVWHLRYIDDGLAGEILYNGLSISTHSTHKEERLIHAGLCEKFLNLTIQNAEAIGMRINTGKTKLLCVSASRATDTNCFINVKDSVIRGCESMKMLGFIFGRRPNSDAHVGHVCSKFYSRLWTVRNLKSSGMEPSGLVKLYCEYIRPVIEYASVVYGPLLTSEGTKKLEKLQERALRTVYNSSASYSKLLEKSGIPRLAERRTEAIARFAEKNEHNPICKEWFERNHQDGRLRKKETYKIVPARSNRLLNGHLNIMRRHLNMISAT